MIFFLLQPPLPHIIIIILIFVSLPFKQDSQMTPSRSKTLQMYPGTSTDESMELEDQADSILQSATCGPWKGGLKTWAESSRFGLVIVGECQEKSTILDLVAVLGELPFLPGGLNSKTSLLPVAPTSLSWASAAHSQHYTKHKGPGQRQGAPIYWLTESVMMQDHTASRFHGREILFLRPQTARSTPTVF